MKRGVLFWSGLTALFWLVVMAGILLDVVIMPVVGGMGLGWLVTKAFEEAKKEAVK